MQAPPPVEFFMEALFFSSEHDCVEYITLSGFKIEGGKVKLAEQGDNKHTKFRQSECKQIDYLWNRGPGRLRKDFIKQGLAIQDGEQAKKFLELEKEKKKKMAELEAQRKAEAHMLMLKKQEEDRKRMEEETRQKKERLLQESKERAQHNWKNLRKTHKAFLLFKLGEAAAEYNNFIYQIEMARKRKAELRKRKMM
mmetsp:Transcript_32977/g.50452  ORF Transcript_32977/g.50452 Transcript_32977/m.50452 type:complete len:196 (-) Transcript_32977:2179-2766(-)